MRDVSCREFGHRCPPDLRDKVAPGMAELLEGLAGRDDVFLALTHTSGVLSHLQAGGVVGAPGPRTRVLGDGGAYLVTSFEGEASPFTALDDAYEETRRPGEPTHEGWIVRGAERSPVARVVGGHVDLYRAVVSWVVDGGPPPVDPMDAARTARVLDAARVSADEGRVVRLP